MAESRFRGRFWPVPAVILLIIFIIVPITSVLGEGLYYTGYGANRVVSGSLHVIELEGEKLILDAGAFFGDDAEKIPELPAALPERVGAVLITHAHLDHSGRLIDLVEAGFSEAIYCTRPTEKLLYPVLRMHLAWRDAGRETFRYSQERREGEDTPVHNHPDCFWKQRIRNDNRGELTAGRPDLADLGFYLCRSCLRLEKSSVLDLIQTVPLGEEFYPAPGIRAAFQATPHIPGAAAVHLEGVESGRTLLYTGDFGSGLSPFLPPGEELPAAEWLIVEGTYGPDRRLDPGGRKRLISHLDRILTGGGQVIMPTFVLDRTQQVLHLLTRARDVGEIPAETELIVTSPTAAEINEIYAETFTTPEFAPFFTGAFMKEGPFQGEIGFDPGLEEVPPGAVVLCAPGAVDGGKSLELVRRHTPDPEASIVFTGYLPEGSVGADLLKAGRGGNEEVDLAGEILPLRAEIRRFSGFSGHAGFEEIAGFIRSQDPRGVLIVHSACETAFSLRDAYRDVFGEGLEILVPAGGERIELKR